VAVYAQRQRQLPEQVPQHSNADKAGRATTRLAVTQHPACLAGHPRRMIAYGVQLVAHCNAVGGLQCQLAPRPWPPTFRAPP